MKKILALIVLIGIIISSCNISGKEYHVSPMGSDSNPGTADQPLQSVTAAAKLAQPGDVITVHEGVYRERINPTTGGTSDQERITYQAAEGEMVVIKGSELLKNWVHVEEDTWMTTVPNELFGDFNPYLDVIKGDWFNPLGRVHHTGAVYLNGHWLTEAAEKSVVMSAAGDTPFWFSEAESDKSGNTTIWAQFKGLDPNTQLVEFNVRQSVFYPEKTGINYITVRGFTLEHAATNWAPPTAEQVGLIGVNWSKGWIIENNIVRYSNCVGITLGKHGDEFDNTSANSAEGYVKTIERGTANGWSGENIGHHIVRNNEIAHCEQAGIVGSLGPIFCKIYENEIHDIHIRRLFTGAEMAGIKFHGAVDTEIKDNHIYRTNRGIWLDWMAQGTRVTCNLLHDNGPSEDLFMEVNHGPSMIDNNILLSPNSLLVNSQGAAYVHNIIAGRIHVIKGENRLTPYLEEHSTVVAGLANNKSGDERFYNNIFSGAANLGAYDDAGLTMWMDGNVFLNGAKPGKVEAYPLIIEDFNPDYRLDERADGWFLHWNYDPEWIGSQARKMITTNLLGTVEVPKLQYLTPDGKEYRIDTDYLGNRRDSERLSPGPFVLDLIPKTEIKVWAR